MVGNHQSLLIMVSVHALATRGAVRRTRGARFVLANSTECWDKVGSRLMSKQKVEFASFITSIYFGEANIVLASFICFMIAFLVLVEIL